ncbi:MAG: Ger(x)C family spore germination C-terminal domain-containing protein [Clostridia bacterium]|nr:Ger(x)C family spore germination C-terminal domain-containing protein [Clostridia bacterium]MDD4375669.1 Ger(x)C family spore germination C-terminal domain-containing protein [Clostridia bacterium]
MKKIKIYVMLVIFILIAFGSKQLIPSKKEISALEIVKIIGLDYEEKTDKKARISIVINKGTEIASSDATTEEDISTQEVLKYEEKSFNTAFRTAQFYNEKIITTSHVRHFLIGEETINKDIDKVIDRIARDPETRLTAKVYTVKDMTANEFLTKLISKGYYLSEKLDSIEDKKTYQTIMIPLKMIDLLEHKLSGNGIYLIPTLEIKEKKESKENKQEENEKNKKESNEENKDLKFDFYGYSIMKRNKCIGYLNKKEAIIYALLKNKIDGGSIDITLKNKNIISFGITKVTGSTKFIFDSSDHLERIELKVNLVTSLDEVAGEGSIDNVGNIKKYEKLQEEKVEKQVYELINKSKNMNCDFLGIEKTLQIKHPYKYKKLQDNFNNAFKSLEFKINVNCKIDRTYDLIKIDK